MKDSGIPWVGKVPSDWEVKKVKYCLRRSAEKNPGDQTILSLYREYGVVPKDSRDDNHNVTSEDTSNYRFVRKGDFVINKMKAWQGSLAVSDFTGVVSPAYYVYRFSSEVIFNKYFHYLMRIKGYAMEFRRLSGGVREGQWDLPACEFEKMLFPLPPLEEQRRIAEYLDGVTGCIDGLREKIGREIERLGEYRKSVIAESVCRGLDKGTPMKDSGIPWVGKVPNAWEIDKIKYWFAATNTRGNSCLQLLAATQKYGMYPQARLEGVVQVAEKTDLNTFKTVHVDDFVISLRSFQGGIERSDYEGVCSPAYQTFHAIREIDTHYFKHFFKSRGFIAAINALTVGIREGKTINYSDVREMKIPVPPLPEQRRIAEYLDGVTAKIDEMIAKRKAEMERLESLKRSIICECVTGKREVPG